MSVVNAELRAFSGNPNPTFDLDDGELAGFATRVFGSLVGGGSPADDELGRLGYAGFAVTEGAVVDLPEILLVFGGVITTVTAAGRTAFADVTGCEDALIQAARNHGLGDVLDGLGVSGGDV